MFVRSGREKHIQEGCIMWFRNQYPEHRMLCFHVPNGGARNSKEGSALKRQGVLAGVSDITIQIPKGKYHGCWFELKTERGTLTKQQKEFLQAVNEQDYYTTVIKSVDQFIEEVESYMNQKTQSNE